LCSIFTVFTLVSIIANVKYDDEFFRPTFF